MNEEEIKFHVVKPFLDDLGISPEGISLEHSFKVPIGRFTHEVIWKEEIKRPRYDILVKVNGKNYFMIEVKTESHEIIDADIFQAKCYAKLVDPPAPFAVVTNGTSTRIFDSLSGEELTNKKIEDSKFVKNRFVISVDDEIRQHALSLLYTLNYDNLMTFCNYQNSETLSKLKATNKDDHKKYIPEVFVKRDHVVSRFYDFTKSDSCCLLVSGNSGIGKTNVICNLVEESREKYPVLFYNASELFKDLGSCLADDFNFEFSAHKPIEQLIKQLDILLQNNNTNLLIFVDAIDEWSLSATSIALNDFIQRIKNKKIKLVLTCKNSKLDDFLMIKGNSSTLSENLFSINSKTGELVLTISEFEFPELMYAIEKYSTYFSLHGFLTNSETFEACKDPFLLRVLAETYSGKEVPPTLNSIEIYRNYLDAIFKKKHEKESHLKNYLAEVAKVINEKNSDEVFESDIKIMDLNLHDFLIDYGIIKRQTDVMGRPKLRFNADGLRNYVMAFYVNRFDEITIENFESFVAKNIAQSLGRELLRWYKHSAKSEQIPILRKYIEDDDKKRAGKYLETFQQIIDRDFPFIKKILFPELLSLGLLILYDEEKNMIMRYGFRKSINHSEKIIWLKRNDWQPFTDEKEWELMMKYESFSLGFSSKDFTNESPEITANRQILRITKDMIKNRRMDESENIGLATEKLFDLLRQHSMFVGLPKYERNFLDKVLPLDAKKLLENLNNSGIDPYMYTTSRVSYLPRNYPLIDLKESLSTLFTKKPIIESALLPLPDDSKYLGWYHIKRAEDYSKTRILEYVKKFFEVFIEEYKIFVETNFPTLKDQFETYKRFPVYVIGQLRKRPVDNKADGLMYAILKNNENKNEIEIRDYDEEPVKISDDEENNRFVIETKNGPKYTCSYTSGMVLNGVFTSYNAIKYSDCPVVDWVYETVNEDLQSLFGEQYKGF